MSVSGSNSTTLAGRVLLPTSTWGRVTPATTWAFVITRSVA